MREITNRNVSTPEWEQTGDVPDWKELPERKREELLVILAGMLVSYPQEAKEGDGEPQS